MLETILAEPQALLRNALRMVHFFGLALGLGTATMLDLMVIRFFMGKPVRQQTLDIFAFCARVVNMGLIALCLSGIGFLLFYWHFDPIHLTNDKIYAKIVIVIVLTINGMFIHHTFLPFIQKQRGRMLLEGVPRGRQHLLITSAMVSVVSWYCPLLIANLPQLNFGVPALQILTGYAVILGSVLLLAHTALLLGPSFSLRTETMNKTENA